jgi:hypothetical protein
MIKSIYAIFAVAFLIGCGGNGSKENQAKSDVQADASAIKITQGEVKVAQKADEHKKELSDDKKGFYYTYDEKKEKKEEEIPTRLQGEKHVKNRIKDGKVAVVEKNHKRENPYDYVRIDLLKNALSHEYMVKCSACHDDYANGIIGPSLLDKDADFIYKQMMKYRDDSSKNIFMYELVNKMSEEELKKIAAEVAEFNKEIRALKGKK